MNLKMDSCQNKDTSATFVTVDNMSFENETKKLDTSETSLDNSTYNTPIYSSNFDLDAPLSPVLSNSKQSMKYIARKKSRIKLMNKFSQNESNCQLTSNTNVRPENFSSISRENPQLAASTNKSTSDEGERMLKIKELQRNRKFCYNIETITPVSTPVLSDINQYNTTNNVQTNNAESSSTCKIPESMIVLNAENSNKVSDHINYEVKHGCPVLIPVTEEIGFSTGAGKKIQLSERALKRAAKIFDDITDSPSTTTVSDNVSTLVDTENDKINCDKIINIHSDLSKSSATVSEKEILNRVTSCEKTVGFKSANGKMLSFSEKTRNKIKNMFDDIFELSLYVEKPEISNSPHNIEDGISAPEFSLKSNDNKYNSSFDKPIEHFKLPVTTHLNKHNKVMEEISPDSKNISFTQANDSQMCWVADNAECMIELTDNKWISSPSNTQESSGNIESSDLNLNQEILKNEQDFQNNLSQETNLLLGNLTILDSFSTLKENIPSGNQLSVCTNNRIVECNEVEEICRGFTSEEYLKSLKIVELYKRAIKYIAEDLKKEVYYPISFIFDDVQHSMEYKNKNLRYSLRSRNKPCVTYVSKKRKSSSQKQKKERVKRRKSYPGEEKKSQARNSTKKNNVSYTSHNLSSQAHRILPIHEEETEENKQENMENISLIFDSSFSDRSIHALEETVLNLQIRSKFQTLTKNNSINSSDTSDKEPKIGFSTASGKKIKISENSLSKVQHIFDDSNVFGEENNESLNSYNNIGFSTASGKKVNISKETLEKSKHIFDDCNVLKGKNCADESENKVKIVEKSINKSMRLFDDCNLLSKENAISDKTKSNIGFSTASGNSINISEESLKKVSNIFNDIDLPNEENLRQYETPKKSFGFSSASGKKVHISEEVLNKSKHIFDKCEVIVLSDTPKINSNCGFSTASGKSVNISEESLKKVKNIFENLDLLTDEKSCNLETPKGYITFGFSTASTMNLNFTTASGKKVEISEGALKRMRNPFDDCDDIDENKDKNLLAQNTMGFTSASGTKINISEESLKTVKHVFDECDINEDVVDNLITPKMDTKFGFATASGKEVNISEDALKNAQVIFEKCDSENNEHLFKPHVSKSQFGFATASGKNVKISEESLTKVQNIFDRCEESINLEKLKDEETNVKINSQDKNLQIAPYSSPVIIERSEPSQITCNESTPVLRNKVLASRSLKKRSLGLSSCRQINISGKSLKKAKLVFEEMDTPKAKGNTNINNNLIQKSITPTSNISTPVLNKNITPTVSTPQIQNISNMNDSIKQSIQLHNSQKNVSKISPVRDENFCNEDLPSSSPFIFREETEGNVKKWKINLKKEYDSLKLKMAVIETRMQMLDKQEEMIDNRRLIPGQLFQQKTGNNKRICLQEFVNNRRPGKNSYQKCLTMGLKQSLLDISSENASKLHFNLPWYPNPDRTYPAVIHTDDSAVIIPNQQNFVGITEIETAFRAMPGVDPDLIAKGWIANHYKWIVWKLASMERNYPDLFTNYLSADNVVSQLKYRYDREIDRAQRPALRKILECDDTAAKRMVLCVSTIIKLTEGKYELQLTDGWYSIKTTIDGPLNSLVCSGVIKVGMKLMVQGAELLNCEGCCPLETPANVRLQIHYNSTRRAAWYARLGYQRNPGPLCISLRTINNNGGPIGLTCAYVTRVYPICFMERLHETLVWRNRKAEQRRANQWESMQAQTMERLQSKVQQELEEEWRNKKRNKKEKIRSKDLQGIHCARTLYEILEDSNDPDSIREMMTSDQYAAVQEYQSRLSMEQQAELNSKLQQKLSMENVKPRNVSFVLKLLLLDVNSPFHSRFLSIWRPKDSHLQELKEGSVVRIYNLSPRNNGSLSTIPRTQFDLNLDFDTEKFEKFERTVNLISQTLKSEFKPLYGEFDTAGMIIFIDVQETNQSLWLADENFKLLLIRIREGAETCCLLDGLILGKIIAVTNLVYQKPSKSYGEAQANHYTTISSYPHQSYLQDFMKELIENLPQDADKYLEECKDQVEIFLAQRLLNSNILNTFIMDYDIENENKDLKSKTSCVTGQTQQKCDGLTLSDEEMSLIDTQML